MADSQAFKRPGVARILARHNLAGDSSHHGGGSRRPSSGGCEPSPSSCAFSFDRFQGSIPEFNMPRGETRFGTFLVADGVSITRLNSDGAQYPCARKGMENLRNQFYARDNYLVRLTTTPLMLFRALLSSPTPPAPLPSARPHALGFVVLHLVPRGRRFEKVDEGKLRGQLVKVPITNVELKVGRKTVKLNQGQGSDVIPENQRCVLFKIGA
ncbi:unnamed protein product [Closterium sp. NIES-64]|nr:unnamed protein product [Closterium sp. NIES-64]